MANLCGPEAVNLLKSDGRPPTFVKVSQGPGAGQTHLSTYPMLCNNASGQKSGFQARFRPVRKPHPQH